jgi:hypothetical protein
MNNASRTAAAMKVIMGTVCGIFEANNTVQVAAVGSETSPVNVCFFAQWLFGFRFSDC